MMTMTIKWMVVSLINYTSACMESMQHDNERSFALNHTSKRIPSIPDPMSTNSDGAVSLLNHWCFYNDVRILIYVKFWACKDLLSLKGETHKNFWITYRSKIKKKKKVYIDPVVGLKTSLDTIQYITYDIGHSIFCSCWLPSLDMLYTHSFHIGYMCWSHQDKVGVQLVWHLQNTNNGIWLLKRY